MPTSNTDEQLEGYINAAWDALQHVAAEPAKRDAWERLRELIGKRSPERIAQMEKAQGLR